MTSDQYQGSRGSRAVEAASFAASAAARGLEVAALFILLLVVAMRPLLTETCDSTLMPIARAVGMPAGLTPAATAWFGLFIWLAAVATAVAAALRRARWRLTGLEVGWVLMLAGAVFSTVVAGNKRIAINYSADWLTAVVLAVTLANLCRDRRRILLVLAALVASGVASAARCGMQVGIENAETWQHYQQIKEDFWRSQNQPLDDPTVELYERRIRAGEATGFLPLGNAQGAFLSLAAFAVLAAMTLFNRGVGSRLFLALLAALLMACILMTGSRGALMATFASLFILAGAWRFQETLRRRWKLLLVSAWLAVTLGTVGVVAWGRAHGGLPGSSLNFRWQYWEVTSRILADRIWSGVGAGNFDRVYLAYKPIEYPEEIRDPHNFVLSLLAQWGLLGGVGLILAMVGASVTVARRWGLRNDPPGPEGTQNVSISPAWLLGVPIGFVILRLMTQSDLLGGGEGGRAMLFFDLAMYGLLWCAVFVDLSWLTRWVRPGKDGSFRLPLLAGVCAFLLANTIDFSLLAPATLTTFAAMAGLMLVASPCPAEQQSGPRRWGPVTIGLVGLAGFVALVFLPVTRSSHWLNVARHTPQPVAAVAYGNAAAADPLDPTPLAEWAGLAVQSGTLDGLNQAVDAINEAIQRDPDRLLFYSDRMNLLEARYRIAGSAADLLGAIGSARRGVEMYPSSPDQHKELSDLLVRANAELRSSELQAEAIHHYREALRLNDARPGTDEARRWSPQRTEQVRRSLQALESPATVPVFAPASQP
ncbi:MAG TPA: O-antigen ligase family protein [Phycisphaerae bacterium]|nr:O-antigen ligase family protein [Phycisphaerae bacterium]